MPNKTITGLDPWASGTGGLDDTIEFEMQVSGGGPGSNYKVKWTQLFKGKDAAADSGDSGIGISLRGGAGDGSGYGGYVYGHGGYGYIGGEIEFIAGNGDYRGGGATLQGGINSDGYAGSAYVKGGASTSGVGGYSFIYGGAGGSGRGGNVVLKGGSGTTPGFIHAQSRFKWTGATAAGAAASGDLYVDASQFVKLKA